ncbi:MAG: AI-2E family transporter [Bradymonadaceae bacterium]
MSDGPMNLGVRTLIAVGIGAVLIMLAILLWQLIPILVLIFAGCLLAIFLRAVAGWLAMHSPFKGGIALGVVGFGLIVLIIGAGWLVAPRVTEQAQALGEALPAAMEELGTNLEEYPWGQFLIGQIPDADELLAERFNVWARLGGVVTATVGVLVDVLVILFVGIYFAINPALYIRGAVRLMPLHRRERIAEILATVAEALRWWLAARLLAMISVGMLAGVGLWALDVPMALTLGLLAGVLAFVPFVGPLVALIPAALLALVEDPIISLYVLILFLAIQAIDSLFITPRLQRRLVDLPIALVLFAQVVMAITVGLWGWLMATPLLVVVVMVIKLFYIEDILGDGSRDAG